jgi:hypothetical protein
MASERQDDEAHDRSFIRRSFITQRRECYRALFISSKNDPVSRRRGDTGSRREWDGSELWRETVESCWKQLSIKRRVWGDKEEETEECQPGRHGRQPTMRLLGAMDQSRIDDLVILDTEERVPAAGGYT